jgi:hypothetical protein
MKQQIKSKFGSVRAFSQASGIKYFTLVNFFTGRMKEEQAAKFESELPAIIESTSANVESLIQDSERETLRVSILTKHKSLRNFCKTNEGFSMTFVSNIIRGARKKKDARYNELIQSL